MLTSPVLALSLAAASVAPAAELAARATDLAAQATPSWAGTPVFGPGTAEDEPDWHIGVVPLALILVGARAELRHTPGPVDQYAVVDAKLTWNGLDVYDPRKSERAPLASYVSAGDGLMPYLDARAGWGVNVARGVRVYLAGHYVASNLEASGASWIAKDLAKQGRTEVLNAAGGLEAPYDPDALVAHRPILTLGPHLEADLTDDDGFPTRGTQLRAAADLGLAALGNLTKSGLPNDFALYRARVTQFVPFGEDRTLALSAVGGYGAGKVPLYLRFSAGGSEYVRGYLRDRFTGDRLAAVSVEWRHLALPGIVEYGDLGLGYHAYLDVGRVWETSCCVPPSPGPIPGPLDLRPGAGVGLAIFSGRSTLLRLDFTAGTEGPVSYPLFGGALMAPVVPGFGLSLTETW